MLDILVLVLAIVLDLVVGEMPAPAHPVVWMGRLLGLGIRFGPRRGRAAPFFFGFALVVVVAVLFGGAIFVLMKYLRAENSLVYVMVGVPLLKSCFSVRELARAARRVKVSLTKDDIYHARLNLRSLVSRDTKNLDELAIVGATVESVAENTSDSFVAPLFWFAVFGLPGAFVYRVANTADAMVGYHGEFEYLGKFAARFDDVLNFVPSRLTGLLVIAASWVARLDVRRSWLIMRRDHGLTDSWNAGWPMSAMAGSLNVRLEKANHYELGDAVKSLIPEAIDESLRLMFLSVAVWAMAVLAAKGVLIVIAT